MYPRFSFRLEENHDAIMQTITTFIAKDKTILDIDLGVAGRLLGFTRSIPEADRMRRYSGGGHGLESWVCRIHNERCIKPIDNLRFRVMQDYGGESSRHLGKFFFWLMKEFEITEIIDDETGNDLSLLARIDPMSLFDFEEP